jgi:hypothetical protein
MTGIESPWARPRLSLRLASRAGVPLTDPLESGILRCAPGP